MSLLFRDATIVTMNEALEIFSGDVLVDEGRIAEIGNLSARQAARTINAATHDVFIALAVVAVLMVGAVVAMPRRPPVEDQPPPR